MDTPAQSSRPEIHGPATAEKGLRLVSGDGGHPAQRTTARLLARLPDNEQAWRTGQLNDLGLNAEAIGRLVGARAVVKVRYGCYVRAAYWDTFDRHGQDRLRILLHAHAAVPAFRGASVYSHVSAARLHRLPLWREDSFIHLTRSAKNSTVGKAADVKIHCRPLREAECTEVDGVRVTNELRTTVDCALTMSYKQALIIMDHALRNGVPRAALEREAAALDGHRGIRIFRAALDFAVYESESAGETLTRDLIDTCNIEPPVLQYRLSTRHGNYRADFAWPRYKVILEFDGEGKYFKYRPTQEVLRDERRRENDLIEQGWTVIRIGWPELFNERLFKTRLLTALRKGGMK
ncbi:type IV toxin-antitoxin system AbiEi family antitoxin domain-containing protein [Specibacter sp. RAF43]|uniref:type IV toxin-antitoxin system AbiEi family antitoxin domain-containing protein n=1 Tax=Specibacter sp. RAF43 TaxID=3233057 RepID=UPI003F9DDE47